MQITKRDQKLLILLACVLLLAGAYQFGYRRYGEKRDKVEKKIEELQTRYDQLVEKNKNREKYLTETKENKDKITKILANYPSQIETENEIYYTKLIEDATGAKVVQMSYTEPESFYMGSEQEEPNLIKGMQSVSTLSVETDYKSLKKLVAYVDENASRRVIQNLSLSYDVKSGTLTGTVAYNSYSLTGTDTTYEPYKIPAGTGQGVSELFGDVVKK